MWKAFIDSKIYESGVLRIGVVYANESTKIFDSIDLTNGNIDTLNALIESKLKILSNTDGLVDKITLGEYVSPLAPVGTSSFVGDA